MSGAPADSWIPVTGNSMHPLLRAGEEVRVEWFGDPAEAGSAPPSLRPGEIAVARESTGEWLVHRVLRAPMPGETRPFRLKGDATCTFEELEPARVWGRVRAVRSRGGDATRRDLDATGVDAAIAAISARVPGAPYPLRALLLRTTLALAWLRRRAALRRGPA